jgi:hypothetical protein
MRERDSRIEDAAKVFDEMPMRAVLKNAKVLLLDEASGVQDTIERMLRRCVGRRCAGRSRAVRDELQYGGCGRIRTGAARSRVMDVGGRRGEGSGRHGPNTGRPRSSRRWRCECGVANRKEKPRSEDSGRA